jgi:hypothetical protein
VLRALGSVPPSGGHERLARQAGSVLTQKGASSSVAREEHTV